MGFLLCRGQLAVALVSSESGSRLQFSVMGVGPPPICSAPTDGIRHLIGTQHLRPSYGSGRVGPERAT